MKHQFGKKITGLSIFILGILALLAPFLPVNFSAYFLGILIMISGILRGIKAVSIADSQRRGSFFLSGGVSFIIGLMLFFLPQIAFASAALILGITWVFDGVFRLRAVYHKGWMRDSFWETLDGAMNIIIGISIAIQWPFSGIWSLAIAVALSNISMGWTILLGRGEKIREADPGDYSSHPDLLLEMAPNHEFEPINRKITKKEESMHFSSRFWIVILILTFIAIHFSRMPIDWNVAGLISISTATIGDIIYALFWAFLIIVPIRTFWRFLTRPAERASWKWHFKKSDDTGFKKYWDMFLLWWLRGRMRFAIQVRNARKSFTSGMGWGLRIGLPLSAIIIAVNPILGLSWFFNTENWVTGLWESWSEYKTDQWRVEMVQAVKKKYGENSETDNSFFRVDPEGINDGSDFSFIVIGDTGEGDASQFSLHDQLLKVSEKPLMKFLILSSDVIYPSGSMKDYEPKFYLPFKGIRNPIYAIPGNHDWYDAGESFMATFLEPDAAIASIEARRNSEYNLPVSGKEPETMVQEAERLQKEFNISAGKQKAPYFDIQTPNFSLIAIDTGILRQIDADQEKWLRSILDASSGKFKMVIIGHPLYAAGYDQGKIHETLGAIHEILREYDVDIVMGGDTHDWEYYMENYQKQDKNNTMYHFVNGGGGAYLSIGTPLDWPEKLPVSESAFYPREDQIVEKLNNEVPWWKQPVWVWTRDYGAWPFTAETMAPSFNFNKAPFYQSFMEIRYEGSKGQIVLVPYGASGQLTWKDLQVFGHVIPEGQDESSPAEFRIPIDKDLQ
jgi:uncharacterized membrane protein HdeD (DUF308 family)